MIRNIRFIFPLLISLFAASAASAHDAVVESVSFEGLEHGDDGLLYAHYNVTYSAPSQKGKEILCLVTPIDKDDEPYPNGKGSFHCAGNYAQVTSAGNNVVTVPVPTKIIKKIPGTGEYHFSVIIGSEEGEPYTEELFSFDYSVLTDTAKSEGMQQAMNLLDMFIEGMGNSAATYEESEECPRCYGSGICRICDGAGSCFACSSSGRCAKCEGKGYIYVTKKTSDW